MDCLNRLEIQQYIDNEVSDEVKSAFFEHLQNCEQCRFLWEKSQTEARETQEMISLTMGNNDHLTIPAFVPIKRNIIQKRWYRYSSVAAGILLILCIYQYRTMINERNERFVRARMEVERNLYESDLNKLWNEKQSIITITDAEGNLIYMNY